MAAKTSISTSEGYISRVEDISADVVRQSWVEQKSLLVVERKKAGAQLKQWRGD